MENNWPDAGNQFFFEQFNLYLETLYYKKNFKAQ